MKKIILFLIGLIIIMMESFFTNFISSYLSINFLLVYTVLIALYIEKNEALIIGGILGLIIDMVSGGIVGITAILFLVIIYFITNVKKSIFKDKKEIICLLVFISSIIYSLVNAGVSAIYFRPSSISIILLKGIILIPFLNTVTAYLAFTIFEDNLIRLREEG